MAGDEIVNDIMDDDHSDDCDVASVEKNETENEPIVTGSMAANVESVSPSFWANNFGNHWSQLNDNESSDLTADQSTEGGTVLADRFDVVLIDCADLL